MSAQPAHWGRPPRQLRVLREPLWERQPGERSKDFAAFAIYRDLPPSERSVAEVAEVDPRAVSTLASISSRFRWEERARAWDDERDRIMRLQQIEQIGEMNDRHAKGAKSLLALVMQPANALVRKLSQGGANDLENMDVRDLVQVTLSCSRAFADLMRVERLARGEHDSSVGVREMGMTQTARALVSNPDAVRLVHQALGSARHGLPSGKAAEAAERMRERTHPAEVVDVTPKPHEGNGDPGGNGKAS